MQETKLEVGAIFEGKVTGITKFGAFVDLGNGKTGMVHISEVAPVFVKEIRDFVTEGQTVKRGERVGRDPRTSAEIVIPASKAPAFKAGKALKESVNK